MKKIFFGLFVFFAVTGVGIASRSVLADVTQSARGWMWGGTEEVSDGVVNGNENPLGWVSVNSATDESFNSYGINVPAVDGKVTGYGWSETLGWIDFDPQDHCGSAYAAASCAVPLGTDNGVFRSSNTLVGWARVVSIATATVTNNSGGWSGWISMSQSSGGGSVPYGVTITGSNLGNYAWSDELGWIDFNKVSIQGTNQLVLCDSSGASVSSGITLSSGATRPLNAYYFSNYSDIADCSKRNDSGVDDVTLLSTTRWTANDTSIVELSQSSPNEIVQGKNAGNTTVTATYNATTASVNITVVSIPGVCGTQATDGKCAKTLSSGDLNLCTPGSVTNFVGTSSGWSWECSGSGEPKHCSKSKCAGHFIEVSP